MAGRLRITYRRSAISHGKPQKETIHRLGLRRLNQVVEHDDSEAIRGMIFKVKHLVAVEEVTE
jgi:large subunit ribosomal protein L30